MSVAWLKQRSMDRIDHKMKILHVLEEIRSSGAEVMLQQALPYFTEAGAESLILATSCRSRGAFAATLEKAGYIIYHIPLDKRRLPLFLIKFRRLLIQEQIDIVHIHRESAFFYLALTTLLTGVRVVRTVHNNFQFEGTLRMIRGWQRRGLARLGCRYLAIGTSVMENERRRFGIEPILAENWCDTERFNPAHTTVTREHLKQQLNLPENAVVLCSVGNCGPAKNHEAIFGALPRLITKYRNLVYLHIGEEESGQPERRLAQFIGVIDHVRFMGRLECPEKYLQIADLFLMPSFYEGFSIAALEAVCSECKVLLADSPGLADWKSWALPNVFYTSTDSGAIADMVDRALASFRRSDPEKFRKLREHYAVAAGSGRYLDIYRILLAGKQVGKDG